ncbi:MAG: amino acid carrier protein [Pseudomonadota bacterium]
MNAIAETVAALGQWLAAIVFKSVSIAGADVQLIVLWLFGAMVFFTLRLRFINLRGFGLGIRALRGEFSSPDAPGDLSPFQSLSTALSGTVGLGNIAGVAIAISIGGPGAAFWMVVIGFFAMSLKFAEVLLAVKYRVENPDGTVSGGPMWYLSRGLARRGMPRLGRLLAYTYAIFALFAFIQILQVNQSYSQVRSALDLGENLSAAFGYGVVFALLAGVALIGGVRSVGRTTSKLAPLMCGLYLLGVAVVLLTNASNIGPAIGVILSDAFSLDATTGGILGAFIAGMRRAVYSNEAGIGSAAIAHAAVKTSHPASEGYVALLEPFVDTIVVCSATAILIVSTGVWTEGYTDIAMTSAAFATVSTWFPIVLAICVFVFALSTTIAVGYYGQQIIAFLFGDSKRLRLAYLVVFCGMLPIGAIADVTAVINLIDSLFFLLSIPNLIGVLLMSSVVLIEIAEFKRYRMEAALQSTPRQREH